jgi:hypothetical protein
LLRAIGQVSPDGLLSAAATEKTKP